MSEKKFFNVQEEVFRIGIGKKKRLNEFRNTESQLPKTLVMEVTSLTDYSADEALSPLE